LSTEAPPGRARQPILYADQLWRRKGFLAGFLVALASSMTSLDLPGPDREDDERDLDFVNPMRVSAWRAFLL